MLNVNSNSIYNLCYFFYKKAQDALKKKKPTISELAKELSEFENAPSPEIYDDRIDLTSPNVASPDLAYNDYLITVANNFNTEYEEVTTKMMNKFVERNKDKINKLRSFFGISRPVYLGGGVDGVAFDIGNGLIAKFITDIFSINKAKEAMERLHQQSPIAKTEAMIHEVNSIGRTPGSEIPITYIIMEKMTPVTKFRNENPDLFKEIHKLTSFIKRKIEDLFQREVWRNNRDSRGEVLKKELHEKILEIIEDCKVNPATEESVIEINTCIADGMINLRNDWLERFVEEVFDKVATERGDLHLGNLGVTGYGTLCFYDPAHRSFRRSIN